MNNYQLYRTNVALSGQLKWDLIIKSTQNTLYVSDFHLSPISINTPYTYKSNEYLVKNKHQDNVKAYYTENKGNFYNQCLDSKFTHNWPIICNEGETAIAYSNIYDMGCKRSKRYNEYGKQFEFFCPVWIEQLSNTDTISFKINIKNLTTNSILGSNVLSISTNGKNKYHDNFVKYFKEYIDDAGLQNGSDDVMNVNFNTNTTWITGLNAATGTFETKHISTLIDNITSRERPLMEADNMIIQSFKDNQLVCKQLINFNLCFNLEDIFSSNIVNMLYGENIIVSVYVSIGDTELELKDFNTEYNYLNKNIQSESNTNATYNVYDYLKDNQYVEFVNKNKFCQSICHWALAENQDYIFNVYDGFSGIKVIDDKHYITSHQYGNAPNTMIKKFTPQHNNTGWITVHTVNIWDDFYKYIRNTNKYKSQCTYISPESNYIHNIKYTYIPSFENSLYVLGLYVKSGLLANILSSFSTEYIQLFSDSNKSVYAIKKDNLLIILADDINNLTFAQFTEDIKKSYDKDFIDMNNSAVNAELKDKLISEYKPYFIELYKMLISKINPSLIIFNNSLKYVTAKGPTKKTSEIEYFKDDNTYNYVFRYDGKIKPHFVTTPCTLYYKDYISDSYNNSKLKSSIYTKFISSELEPLYPSINYCAIKPITNWNYTICPTVQVSEYTNPVNIYGNMYEYSWFNDSRCLILKNEIKFSYVKYGNDTKTLDTIILEYLSAFYKTTDSNVALFIKSLYSYKNNWEYNTDETTTDYVYNISLKLKS